MTSTPDTTDRSAPDGPAADRPAADGSTTDRPAAGGPTAEGPTEPAAAPGTVLPDTAPAVGTVPDPAVPQTAAFPATTGRTVRIGDDAVLASDGEREHVTDRLRRAAAEGRLTLDEADERQSAAYAARTRDEDELVPLLAGLPPVPRPRRPQRGPLTPRARRNLQVHAGVTVAVLLFLVVVAVLTPAPLFMPLGPAFWLGLILFVHARRAEREPTPDDAIPDELR